MTETERILLECRYLLSLNKTYLEIAKHLSIEEDMVYNDLHDKLPKIDSALYSRVKKKLEKIV